MRRPSTPLLVATAVVAAVTVHGAVRPAPAPAPAAARKVLTFASGVSAPAHPAPAPDAPAAAQRRAAATVPDQPAGDEAQGWRVESPTGWAECTPAVVPAPAAGDAFPSTLDVTAEVSPGPYDAEGGLIAAKVYVTNNGERPVTFTGRSLGTFLDADGHAAGGRFRAQWMEGAWGEGEPQEIEPYEYAEFRLELYPQDCGDSPDAFEPLSPGDYSLVLALDWSADDANGRWLSAPVPVPIEDVWGNGRPIPNVDADWHALKPGPDAPCRTDGTACDEPWNVPPSCSTATPPHGDLGHDLRLTAEAGEAVAGRSVPVTFTVANDGPDVAWLTLDDRWDSGWLGSAVLGEHAGGRQERYVGARYYRLEPGRSMRVTGQVATTTCEGTPLLPGPYTVTAGLYVEGFGWWLAPATSVLLRPV